MEIHKIEQGVHRIESEIAHVGGAGAAEVHALNDSSIEVSDHGVVHAFDKAIVRAMDDAVVFASNDAIVHAYDRAVVYACGRAKVFTFSEQAKIFVFDDAEII